MSFNEEDIARITKRPGYGIAGGIKGTVGAGAALSKAGGSGKVNDLESAALHESLAAKKLQVGYSGLPEIRITFYRHRLADHSRAVSEKALVDCLQYAGLISGDSQDEIRLTYAEQAKIGTNEEERTEIEIIYPEVDYDNLWVPAARHMGR